jgi:hypothetical protein
MSMKIVGKGQLRKTFSSADEPITITLQFDSVAESHIARNLLGAMDWRADGSSVVWHGSYDALEERIAEQLGVPDSSIQPARHTALLGPVFEVALNIS